MRELTSEELCLVGGAGRDAASRAASAVTTTLGLIALGIGIAATFPVASGVAIVSAVGTSLTAAYWGLTSDR